MNAISHADFEALSANQLLGRHTRAQIEHAIEILIDTLDRLDGDTDLEDCDDDQCLAADDGCYPLMRIGTLYFGEYADELDAVIPTYGADQSRGPISIREAH